MTQPAPLPVTDRLGTSLAAITRAQVPRLPFLAVWEYAVIAVTPGPPVLIDCQAIDPDELIAIPPTLVGVTLWPGPSGFVAVPPVGSKVRIQFINGDPSHYAVVGLDPNIEPTLVFGYTTGTIQLGDVTATPLVKSAAYAALVAALTKFATGLNPTTLAAQATALVAAIGLLPPAPTTKVLGT